MKLFLRILLVIVGAGIGAVAMQLKNSHDLAAVRAENIAAIEKAHADLQQKTDTVAALESKTKILNAESAALREKLQALAPAPSLPVAAEAASPAPAKNAFAGMFGKMFKDPEMKKAMAAQQAVALRQIYADFAKLANLTPQETEKLYDLLTQRQMAMMEKAGDMMNGSSDTKAAEAATADAKKQFDDDLKTLLGDSRASQFQTFEKSLGDRIALTQLNQQLASSGTPLNDGQRDGLLQIIGDERSKQPASPIQSGNPSGLAAMTEEAMTQYFTSQSEMNARVRTRAMSLLTAQQMQALEQGQKQQLEMQKAGLKMARQMFAPQKDGE